METLIDRRWGYNLYTSHIYIYISHCGKSLFKAINGVLVLISHQILTLQMGISVSACPLNWLDFWYLARYCKLSRCFFHSSWFALPTFGWIDCAVSRSLIQHCAMCWEYRSYIRSNMYDCTKWAHQL